MAFRFTFGNIKMYNGIKMIAVLLGVYAVAQLIARVNGTESGGKASILDMKGQKKDHVSLAEVKETIPTMAKSSVIGSVIGAISGTGSAIAA